MFENALGDEINEDTMLTLVNTIYFKSDWLLQFPTSNTKNKTFTNLNGDSKSVPFITETSYYYYRTFDEFNITIVKIPYVGDKSMIVLLPNKIDGLENLRKTLIDEQFQLEDLLSRLEENEIEISLPKFSFETELDLRRILTEMGIKRPFGNEASFKAMSNANLKVDSAVHKAFIAVSEEGTEAGAVTGFSFSNKSGSGPTEITIDHSFAFIIRDDIHGLNLFQGFVSKL